MPSSDPGPARLLLAISDMPSRADALSRVASATGFSLPDVRLRLTGTLPRVLLSDTNVEHVRALAAELEQHGFVTLVCDPAQAPADANRIVARQLELSPGGLVAIARGAAGPRSGAERSAQDGIERSLVRHPVAGDAIALLQRGFRFSTTRETITTSERKMSLGRVMLSGGLLMSKAVKKTSVQVSESREAMLLVQRHDGQPEIVLYEQQLDYHFLGARMQPAAHANLMLTLEHIRAMAPRAPLDARVAQAAFVQRLEPVAVGDPLDLALHLVWLAHRRQAGG